MCVGGEEAANGVDAMAENESYEGRTEKSLPPNFMSPEIAAMGQKRVEDFVKAQTELLDKFQEANRHWFDRMQSEANIASEFATKVIGARSITDAMAACQEWTTRRFEMAVEDGKRLVAETQKVMETGTRLLSNGWPGYGRGGLST
jgi:Phasin protein